MASLKHNGIELFRLVFERTDSDGVKWTMHASWGSRGWLLERLDVVYLTGNRVRGKWKRTARMKGAPHEPDPYHSTRERFLNCGWREVTQ